jgi:hypothetical protein
MVNEVKKGIGLEGKRGREEKRLKIPLPGRCDWYL